MCEVHYPSAGALISKASFVLGKEKSLVNYHPYYSLNGAKRSIRPISERFFFGAPLFGR